MIGCISLAATFATVRRFGQTADGLRVAGAAVAWRTRSPSKKKLGYDWGHTGMCVENSPLAKKNSLRGRERA